MHAQLGLLYKGRTIKRDGCLQCLGSRVFGPVIVGAKLLHTFKYLFAFYLGRKLDLLNTHGYTCLKYLHILLKEIKILWRENLFTLELYHM